MTKHIALAVLLSSSMLSAPVMAQNEIFRSQINAPIFFGLSSGEEGPVDPGEGDSDPVPVELSLAGHC